MTQQKHREHDTMIVVLAWIIANPIPSLTILGVLSYLVFRIAFLIYYSHFGVTPEEVGLGYADILTTQAAGGLFIILVCIGIALSMRLKLVQAKSKMEKILSESEMEKIVQDEGKKLVSYTYYLKEMGKAAQSILWTLILIPLLYFIIVVRGAIEAGDAAREPSIFNAFFQGRATPVIALWSGHTNEDGTFQPILYKDFGINYKDTFPSFLLLGERDGIFVLYDKKLGAIRLTRDKVVLITR